MCVLSHLDPTLLTHTHIHTLYLLLIRHQHFASLLDHRLRFELLLREAMPPRVKRFLARDAGEGQVSRIGVKVHHDISRRGTGAGYWRRRAGGAGRWVLLHGLST